MAKTTKQKLDDLEAAKPGEYQGAYGDTVKGLANDIINRKPFSYDFDADPIYQRYKDRYTRDGKMAMQDTMGNAAALSGGYGNSYATTAGSQAYQQYLSQANDIIPQLYDAAYNRYNAVGNEMRSNLSLLQGLDDSGYARYRDKVGDWRTDRSYLANRYTDERNYEYQVGRDNVSDSQWNKQFAYQQDRDKVSDSQWNRQFDYQKSNDDRNYALSAAKAATSGKSTSSKMSDIPQMILDKMDTLENDTQLDNYISSLLVGGAIDNQQANALRSTYAKASYQYTDYGQALEATGYNGKLMSRSQFEKFGKNDSIAKDCGTYEEYLNKFVKKYKK